MSKHKKRSAYAIKELRRSLERDRGEGSLAQAMSRAIDILRGHEDEEAFEFYRYQVKPKKWDPEFRS